jgi:cysteine synthase
MLYQNVLSLIGNTPMVKVNKINPNHKVNLYIKLEGQNPGGSIKDRIALFMIETA